MYNVTITFNVNGQIISRNEKDATLLSDSIDLIKARFNFSPEWQGYTKTAIFKSNAKKPYSRILVDDVCMVPPEAIKKSKYMSVSVFGVSGTQLITATDQIVPLTPSGYTDDSIVSPAPTENVYQQMVTIMETQAVDATRAETAQGEAEQAERTAKSHAEQTSEDRTATGEDRVATGADRSAVNTALLGFAETTLPNAIQAVEDKADTEIARVEQAGDTQVQVVNAAGAEQIGLAMAQADRAEGEADRSKTEADKSEQSATIAANNILNGVTTHNASPAAHDDIREAVQQAENIARGRATAYVFDTYPDMVEWLGDPEHTGGLVRGDNLYIRDVGVKDYWWDGEAPQELEAEAPDLTDYYTRAQVDGMLAITLSRSEYDALETPEAGRVYNVWED